MLFFIARRGEKLSTVRKQREDEENNTQRKKKNHVRANNVFSSNVHFIFIYVIRTIGD